MRSNVLDRIKNLIDTYSVQRVKRSVTFIDRDCNNRLTSVNLGDIQSQEIEWFWKDRYSSGTVNTVAGEPGAGKSLWTLDTAARVTRGRPWPDVEGDNPVGSVLLVSCEDSLEHTVKPRLEAAGADTSKINVISTVTAAQGKRRLFNLQSDLELLEDQIKPDTRLLVFDPISAFVGGAGFSMNTKVRSILDPLARFASRHNVTIFLVTHLNKNVRANATHRILGSVGQVAVARSTTTIRRDDKSKDRRLLIPGKMNLRKEPPALAYWIRDGFIEYEPEPIDMDGMESWPRSRPTPRLDEAVEWLKETLADGPVKSIEVLSRAVDSGISDDTLRRGKEVLNVSVYKVGNGENSHWLWALPITGELSGNSEDIAEEKNNRILRITVGNKDDNR